MTPYTVPAARGVLALLACSGLLALPDGGAGWIVRPAAAASLADSPAAGPRQRLSLNEGWRFQMGDPEGAAALLQYDTRPEIRESADGKVADARPDEAEKPLRPAEGLLKPWVLSFGNAFVADPARRARPPSAAPTPDVSYLRHDFDDKAWRAVTLPHDWAIAGPFLESGPYGGMGRLKTWGPAWYRKALDIPAGDKGKSLFLDIDGAMSHATVWLNGRLVGGWPYGYASFRVDLTPHVVPGGVNQLAIRLDNPAESARWYPGAGLYRNVWLTKTQPVHVAHWGTVVTTPEVSAEAARVELAVKVDNDGAAAAELDVATRIFELGADGKPAGNAVAAIAPERVRVGAGASATVNGAARVARPKLWGPPPQQRPNRYVAVTTVSRDGRTLDRYETPFGIRSLRFDPDHGLHVNGQKVMINGVNNHHDLGALGAAFNVRAAERQLELLREMGANALRMSHNPPAPELLELTDRMGILVMDEVFDSWERKKTPHDFHLLFPDWQEQDLRAMLRRDRNHPSVIMWSVGNEVGEQYTGEAGAAIGRRLVAITREEDPTRPATTAMNFAKADMPLPATMDVISLNYQGAGIRAFPGQFPAFRARFPDKMILSAESASALSSRGEYQFPVPGVNSAPVRPGSGGDPKTAQVSAYELFAADFGSSADRSWAAQDQNPYVAGEFVWTGFDYIGEPTPYYSARSSYSGIIDLAGFKKDRFYLYQSRWRPDLPMAHILPHWTWPGREGEVTPVHVFTSGDEAELFVNGKSQGRKKKAPYEYRLRWDYVTYAPGEVRVVAYKDGKEWARDAVRTAREPAALRAEADRAEIAGDGKDLSFVTVRLVDRDGRTAPRASQSVRFSVEGPGEIVATDNGDPTSFEPFQSPARRAFNGHVLAIVRAKPGTAGAITVRAEADGLRGTAVSLRSR
ncbi:beta-galactosidase GalB [Pseudoduganella namucuonensis]|uniref:Beta-galactosidase n=1 Tax=Pseudoduganella namucuonensis TaxID=1035707 RepID=A0A1I7J2V7_9BURK|nr:beta-galactosidase GalB [Pseudoduganella namucuonensis]SFU79487.1 beta-galactosidase [Pseudoduganella namucuonensis]